VTSDIRAITARDLELICRHREEMFLDAGSPKADLADMTEHFRLWLAPRLADGSYFGFVATSYDVPIASIGLMVIDWPPHPSHPTQSERGYVLNVFVEPDFRRQGLASRLMRRAEAEFVKRGVQFAILHATEKGHPLYRALGWNTTSEMARALTSPIQDET
jgi:GNAT superfamily N-acetyltransferase